jgi:DNA-binding transcriptional ArsR family regulator
LCENDSNSREKPRLNKGWVREAVLSSLTVAPMTLTEISSKLGVSKSTASYHLSLLKGKGAIEMVGSAPGKGGVVAKRYALRGGSVVLVPGVQDEEAELARLRETFDLEELAWRSKPGEVGADGLQRLLYKMFLHLFRITRTGHRTLMEEYGRRAGGTLAGWVPTSPSRVALLNVVSYLRSSGIADADLVEVPDTPVTVLVSSSCLGSTAHPGNACYFFEGLLKGILGAKIGTGVKVGRVEVSGFPGCCLAVGRVKSLDLDWIADAVLTSPSYSAINRGRGRARRIA